MPTNEEQAVVKPVAAPAVAEDPVVAQSPHSDKIIEEMPASPLKIDNDDEEAKIEPLPQLQTQKSLQEMSLAERKRLRKMRFKPTQTDLTGGNTLEMQERLMEQKEKMKARAQRFGIVTKEMNEERIKNRQKRFGIETKESLKEKIE